MKSLYFLFFTMIMLHSGCGGSSNVEQKQNDIFPFPCKTRERAYYVDKDGNEMETLDHALVNLNLGNMHILGQKALNPAYDWSGVDK